MGGAQAQGQRQHRRDASKAGDLRALEGGGGKMPVLHVAGSPGAHQQDGQLPVPPAVLQERADQWQAASAAVVAVHPAATPPAEGDDHPRPRQHHPALALDQRHGRAHGARAIGVLHHTQDRRAFRDPAQPQGSDRRQDETLLQALPLHHHQILRDIRLHQGNPHLR